MQITKYFTESFTPVNVLPLWYSVHGGKMLQVWCLKYVSHVTRRHMKHINIYFLKTINQLRGRWKHEI